MKREITAVTLLSGEAIHNPTKEYLNKNWSNIESFITTELMTKEEADKYFVFLDRKNEYH